MRTKEQGAGGRLAEKARADGRKAREQGKGLDACPRYAAVSVRRAWQQGWGEGAPPVPVAAAEPAAPRAVPLEVQRWPEGAPMPGAYRRQLLPCPHCRATLTSEGRKALVLTSTSGSVAYFQCVAPGCEKRSKLPIEEDGPSLGSNSQGLGTSDAHL